MGQIQSEVEAGDEAGIGVLFTFGCEGVEGVESVGQITGQIRRERGGAEDEVEAVGVKGWVEVAGEAEGWAEVEVASEVDGVAEGEFDEDAAGQEEAGVGVREA